jgi:hypothetical protein
VKREKFQCVREVGGQGHRPAMLLTAVWQGKHRCVKELAAEPALFAQSLVE